MVQAISGGGVDYSMKVGALCAHCFDTESLVKTQLENGLNKLFNFQGQTIDVFDQAILTLKYLGLHDEEGNKINISDLLTTT